MHLILVSIAAIVAFVVFVAAANHFGFGVVLTAIRNRLGETAENVSEIMRDVWYETVVPVLRTLSVLVALLLAVGVVLSCVSGTWWVILVSVLIAVVGVIAVLVNRLRPREEFRLSPLLTIPVLSFAVFGLWEFVGGVAAHNRAHAVIGALFLFMARDIVFATLEVMARLAALGIDLAEGSSNVVVRFAMNWVTKDKKPLPDVNIADQERWVPWVKNGKRKINRALYPVIALGILMPYPVVLGFSFIVAAVTAMAWGNLESEGVDTSERRRKSAAYFEVLCFVLLGFDGLVIFIPDAEQFVDVLFRDLQLGTLSILGGFHDGLNWIHQLTSAETLAMICGTVLLGALAAVIWGNGVRKLLAVPFILLALYGTAVLGLHVTGVIWHKTTQAVFGTASHVLVVASDDGSSKDRPSTSSGASKTVPEAPPVKPQTSPAAPADAPAPAAPIATAPPQTTVAANPNGQSADLQELCRRFPRSCE